MSRRAAEIGRLGRVRALLWPVCLWLVLLWTFGHVALADSLDDETRRIAKQLQCPVCEGVSVADSPSELAGQMRAVVRRQLEQGASDEQILGYFVERYGDAVLVEPPRRGFTLAVWLGPIVALAVGGGLLLLALRRWLRPAPIARAREDGYPPSVGGGASPGSAGADRDWYAARARRELAGFREEA